MITCNIILIPDTYPSKEISLWCNFGEICQMKWQKMIEDFTPRQFFFMEE